MRSKKFLSIVGLILVSGMILCSAVGCASDAGNGANTETTSDTDKTTNTATATNPATTPATDPETKPETDPVTAPVIEDVTIGTAEELVAFATAANDGTEDYTGVTIKLTADIDLKNIEWTPIAGTGICDAVIDGDGHTISNMTINGAGQLGFIGLIGPQEAVTVQNVTFDNCIITATSRHIGVVIGEITEGYASVSNVTVKNSTINGAFGNDVRGVEDGNPGDISTRVAAIAGMVQTGAAIDVDGCTIDGLTISGYHNLASLVGYVEEGQSHFTNNTVKNVSISFSTGYAYGYNDEDDETGHGRKFTNVFYNDDARSNHEENDAIDKNTFENVVFHDIVNNIDYNGYENAIYSEPAV